MSKFTSEIEVSGHLIDSLILTKIFDNIVKLGFNFSTVRTGFTNILRLTPEIVLFFTTPCKFECRMIV